MKKAIKIFFKYMSKAMKLLFIVFILFFGSLFFRDQKLPRFAVERLTRGMSGDGFEIVCDDAYFGFRHGLRVSGVRLFDRGDPDFRKKPVAVIRNLHYDFIKRELWVHGLEFDRLPDGYYHARPSFAPPSPLEFAVPDMEELSLLVESSRILGLDVDRASAVVKCSATAARISADNVEIVLSGKDSDTSLRGFAVMDLKTQKIKSRLATHRAKVHHTVGNIRCAHVGGKHMLHRVHGKIVHIIAPVGNTSAKIVCGNITVDAGNVNTLG